MNEVICLVEEDNLKPWSFYGYEDPIPKPKNHWVQLITPPSLVNVLKAGYPFV